MASDRVTLTCSRSNRRFVERLEQPNAAAEQDRDNVDP